MPKEQFDIGKLQEEKDRIVKEIIEDETILDIKMNAGRFFAIVGILISMYESSPNSQLRETINSLMNDNIDNPKLQKLIKMLVVDLNL